MGNPSSGGGYGQQGGYGQSYGQGGMGGYGQSGYGASTFGMQPQYGSGMYNPMRQGGGYAQPTGGYQGGSFMQSGFPGQGNARGYQQDTLNQQLNNFGGGYAQPNYGQSSPFGNAYGMQGGFGGQGNAWGNQGGYNLNQPLPERKPTANYGGTLPADYQSPDYIVGGSSMLAKRTPGGYGGQGNAYGRTYQSPDWAGRMNSGQVDQPHDLTQAQAVTGIPAEMASRTQGVYTTDPNQTPDYIGGGSRRGMPLPGSTPATPTASKTGTVGFSTGGMDMRPPTPYVPGPQTMSQPQAPQMGGFQPPAPYRDSRLDANGRPIYSDFGASAPQASAPTAPGTASKEMAANTYGYGTPGGYYLDTGPNSTDPITMGFLNNWSGYGSQEQRAQQNADYATWFKQQYPTGRYTG